MPKYSYRVKDRNGKVFSSSMFAESMPAAASDLEKKGYFILEIKEQINPETSTQNKSRFDEESKRDLTFSLKEKKEFFGGFYQFYASGYSISEIFKSLALTSSFKNVKILCGELFNKIEDGKSLDFALASYKDILGFAYTGLISAGEKSGKLEDVLERINFHIKREEDVMRMMISSFTYPLSILCFALGAFLFFKFFLFKLFASFSSGPMCFFSLLTLLLGAILKIFCIFILIFGVIYYVVKNKNLSLKIMDFFCERTLFSAFIKNYNFLNYFSVLSLAYESGMSFGDSIPLANSVIKTRQIKAKLTKALFMIMNECEVYTAFGVAGVFSEYAMSQIAVGQKTGEFDKAFNLIAQDYEQKLEESLKVLSKVLEPLMLVFVGIIVCAVAVTFYRNLYAGIFSMF